MANSAQKIESVDFLNCFILKKVTIPNDSKLEVIEDNVFNCAQVLVFIVPPKVKIIKRGAFTDCSKFLWIWILKEFRANYNWIECIHKHIDGRSLFSSKSWELRWQNICEWNISRFQRKTSICLSFIKQWLLKRQTLNHSKIEFDKDCQLFYIGDYAFAFSIVQSLTFPANVTKVSKVTLSCYSKLNLVIFMSETFFID